MNKQIKYYFQYINITFYADSQNCEKRLLDSYVILTARNNSAPNGRIS
jgi:hypothetical protein